MIKRSYANANSIEFPQYLSDNPHFMINVQGTEPVR